MGNRPVRFTLVELMIVVTIIGVLSALAVPVIAGMQVRARFSECAVNIEGISDTVSAGIVDGVLESGSWGDWHPRPFETVDRNPWVWGAPSAQNWPALGYAPDGPVRCAYTWTVAAGPGTEPSSWVSGGCNVDADENYVQTFLDGPSWGGKVFGPDGCVWEGFEGKGSCPSY